MTDSATEAVAMPMVQQPLVDAIIHYADTKNVSTTAARATVKTAVQITNARLIDDPGTHLGLDGRGFALVRHDTAFNSTQAFRSSKVVRTEYYAELEALAKRLTGAERCVAVEHILRTSGKPTSEELKSGYIGPGPTAHNDFIDGFAEQNATWLEGPHAANLRLHTVGVSPAELRNRRIVVLNFWRSLVPGELLTKPLALCDARTVTGNLTPFSYPMPPTYGMPSPNQGLFAYPDPNHRWYYYPAMRQEEVLVFKTYDSAKSFPGNGCTLHGSFNDPSIGSRPAPPRQSCDARVFCIFPETVPGAYPESVESRL